METNKQKSATCTYEWTCKNLDSKLEELGDKDRCKYMKFSLCNGLGHIVKT